MWRDIAAWIAYAVRMGRCTETISANVLKNYNHCRNVETPWNTICWAVSTSLPHLSNVVSKRMKTKRKLVHFCVIQHWTRGKGKGVSTTCGSACIENKRIECLVRLRYSLTWKLIISDYWSHLCVRWSTFLWLLFFVMDEMEHSSNTSLSVNGLSLVNTLIACCDVVTLLP